MTTPSSTAESAPNPDRPSREILVTVRDNEQLEPVLQ